jgi:hypothetical protein
MLPIAIKLFLNGGALPYVGGYTPSRLYEEKSEMDRLRGKVNATPRMG